MKSRRLSSVIYLKIMHWADLSGPARTCGAVLFYFLCSVSMNFLNKAVVSSYDFNYPFTIMSCQMLATIVFVDTLRLSGVVNLPPYSFAEAKVFLSASLSFAIHAILSLIALHGMNIPMYGAIKRCTPLVSLLLSVVVLRRPWPSPLLVMSVLIITGGVLIAGLGDLQFDNYAYTIGTFSVIAQGTYLTLVQKCSETHQKGTLDMVHINAYNTLPFFLATSILAGEPGQVFITLKTEDSVFYYVFTILILSGCMLTFSQFMCASVSSALTASMVGVFKSVIQTSIGFFTFGGVKYHPLNIIGLVLNIFGGIVYTYVKHVEKRRDKSKAVNGAGPPKGARPRQTSERADSLTGGSEDKVHVV